MTRRTFGLSFPRPRRPPSTLEGLGHVLRGAVLAGALAIVLWQITILATLALKIRPGFVLDSSPGLAVVHVAVASLLARWFWRQGDRAVAVSFMTFFATAHFGTAARMILANP